MNKRKILTTLLCCGLLLPWGDLPAQEPIWWHGIEREIHYKPSGEDFLLVKGRRRFNRALYGGNTAFRVEAGDLPELALYLPGMGGNLKFGLLAKDGNKWVIDAARIETRYRPGSMLYTITDPLLGKGSFRITVLALHDREGMVVRTEGKMVPPGVQLLVLYGGATGQKFSRDGDIGADPESSFDLKAENCKNNVYTLRQNRFDLLFGFKKPLSEAERYEIQHLSPGQPAPAEKKEEGKTIRGFFPVAAQLKLVDATQQKTPAALWQSIATEVPALAATLPLQNGAAYFLLVNGKAGNQDPQPSVVFYEAEKARQSLAGRITVRTPDTFLNNLGGALGMAADAVWETPSFLHGAVAWRMRLNGWRGAYLADVLGWHDRARQHFSAYAKSQVTQPATGPVVMDTALRLGRGAEKMGTSFFSSGYISRNPGGDQRPHHYDMNLVFVDQLLNHFQWTGDTAYVREMWPLLVRHLDWEKRNFDRDGDGLYDAYAAIWASDALQYSGGGVTHSSAYNYRANKAAAELARLIGENGAAYKEEAAKILSAMNRELWLKNRGWFAEYKDLLGEQRVHPAAGLWTVYHALDATVPDPFQAYGLTKYINREIPHIPVRAKGLADNTLYTLSTTSWQPYTWSLNNVALAELLHTSLAYWQAGQPEEAYRLWKSSLVESFYLGASPGNFQQLSFYDAVRGELYRDFADPIGMAARSLVEGLFGIRPDLLHNRILIRPGFPQQWNEASLSTPDIRYRFFRKGNKDQYFFNTFFRKAAAITLQVLSRYEGPRLVTINGQKVSWQFDTTSVGHPLLVVEGPAGRKVSVEITWDNKPLETLTPSLNNDTLLLTTKRAMLLAVHDPQEALVDTRLLAHRLEARILPCETTKTFFVQVRQGAVVNWWPVDLPAKKSPVRKIVAIEKDVRYQTVDLSRSFNDDVKQIFLNRYCSPRPATTTLQLPLQGIGNWAYPTTTAVVDDAGLRKKAGANNTFLTSEGVPFATPSKEGEKNIVFASQWDNYPNEVSVPLQGRAKAASFLVAGSTNPLQSRLVNGVLLIRYKDGSSDSLLLKNPENWWPIEQDYLDDGFAFTTGAPKPLRVYLKTGEDTRTFDRFITIKGFSNRGIDGGAATVLEMPLDPARELESLTVRAIANDVVIGLMAVTLLQ